MIEKYTLDMLNKNSVSAAKQSFLEYNGQQYPVSDIWRRAYVNSISGREQVIAELPKEQQTAIFAIWGDTATVVND